MKIVVIGWGSLIYCPRKLQISSKWRKDGPELPVEFLRVSKDNRLTLVIDRAFGAKCVTTLWAYSSFHDIYKAKNDLKEREETCPKYIGLVQRGENYEGDSIRTVIQRWLFNKGIDAAVYTDLPPKNSCREALRMSWPDIVKHIRNNKSNKEIETYVRRTPEQIETPMRGLLRETYGWQNIELSPDLFDKET